MERALDNAEARFRLAVLPPVRDGQVRVELEGELLAGHSFSIVNERLCGEFLRDEGLALAVRRKQYNPTHKPRGGPQRMLEALATREFTVGPEVTIRHAFPPNWERPARGSWVHIQYWEYGSLPIDWLKPLRDEVDEIWAASNYLCWVYESSGVPAEKIRVIPLGVDPEVYRPDLPGLMLPTPAEFAFLFVGGTIPRKGFDWVLEAYLAEFAPDEDVCLVVKDMGTDTFYRHENARQRVREAMADPKNPHILYYDQFLTEGQLASLYTTCHCLVAPYRGEGFGLPILEAMACGLPPIIPQGGPSDDFTSTDTAYLLPAVSVPCEHPWKLCGMPTQLSINIADLRQAMRTAFEERTVTYEKGMRASNHVRANFTWTKTAELMSARIRELADRDRQRIGAGTGKTASSPTTAARQPVLSGNSHPRLSLAMIVRDNRRTIRAALESIGPWVDELVVVDTGSTDETPRIAESLGARLFHFPWCDDFSAARNESLQHATGDWVFWMDSDDVIDEANGRNLQALMRQNWPDHILGHVMQVHCPGPELDGDQDVTVVDHVKVFRNLPDLRFDGRIHEQILPAIRRSGGDVAWTDIFVVHSGADHSPAGLQRKRARDLRLLQLELAERPNHPFTLFNLGMTKADAGQFAEAIDYLMLSISHAGDADSFLPKAYSLWIACLRTLGRIAEATEKCEHALRLYPNDPELRFRRANLLTDVGRLEDAIDEFQSVLRLPVERQFSSMDRGIRGSKAHFNLAIVYGKLERFADAERSWRAALAASPRFRPAWEGLVEALLRQKKFDEALQTLAPLVRDGRRRNLGLVLTADVHLARGDIAAARDALRSAVAEFPDDLLALRAACRILFEHVPPADALPAQQLLAERCPDDASAQHNLGTLHFRAAQLDKAIECYHRALAVRPDFATTHLYLGQALHSQGKSKEAETYWARARELDPENVPSLEDLAQAS
jgi:tetratricopeptide (TPR) repeat protein/glycosyltransferase involved in cell wall biosynthesis